MNTSELKVSLPPGLSEDEAELLLAVKLYEVGKVSLGQAAKIAGFSKRAFMEILGRYFRELVHQDQKRKAQELQNLVEGRSRVVG